MCQLAGGPLVLSKCLRHMHFSWCHLPEILHLNTLKEWGIQGAGKKKKSEILRNAVENLFLPQDTLVLSLARFLFSLDLLAHSEASRFLEIGTDY